MRTMIARMGAAVVLSLLATLLVPGAAQAQVRQDKQASGEYIVAHPRYSGVCGKGWTWQATRFKAKHNQPRIMSYRIFTKGSRNFCVVVAHAGKAIGATGPTIAALVTEDRERVASGRFAYYAVVKLKGDPCLWLTAVVRYGDQQAVREGAFMCGR